MLEYTADNYNIGLKHKEALAGLLQIVCIFICNQLYKCIVIYKQ